MDKEKKPFNLDELIKLAENGDVIAQKTLGKCYFFGLNGLTIDYEESVKWWTLAANSGDAAAQNNLASCYADGMGVTSDRQKALMWFEKAATQGSLEAIFNLGKGYLMGHTVFEKDVPLGFLYMKEAAEKGLAEAQYWMGQLYNDGIGCESDTDESLKWLEKAAQQGHMKANTMSGELYMRHRCLNYDDVDKAISYFSKAAADGDPYAQLYLGEINLKKGEIEKGVKWYADAAKQNEPEALFFMGLFYNMGMAVPKDHNKAVTFMEKLFNVQKKPVDYDAIEHDLFHGSYDLFCSLGNAALFGRTSRINGLIRGNYTEEDHEKAIAFFNGALEMVENKDDNVSAPMKIDAIIRVASVYREERFFGITRLLYSRAKWLSLLHHDMTRYVKIIISELQILLSNNKIDEANKLIENTYQHFEESDFMRYNMDIRKPKII